VFIEERNNQWNTLYLFNAKELDEETGLYYYGARYYDGRVSVWLGVDPMWEKYPRMSVYAYCANNPMTHIDPDGKRIIFMVGNKDFLYDKRGLTDITTGKPVNYPSDSHLARVVNAYNKALNCGDEVISGKVQDLIDSKNDHYIEGRPSAPTAVEGGAPYLSISEAKVLIDAGKGVGTKTRFDFSERAKTEFKESTGVENSDFAAVVHELQHQHDYDKGKMADGHNISSSAKNPAEIRAVNTENRARKIENLPKRTKYGGEEINPKKLE
jgi:RHS repeat-associated protein